MSETLNSPTTVVVGVDGSEHSKCALAWAARYAELSRSPLWVVSMWDFPTSYGWALPLPDDVNFEADTKEMLDAVVNEVLGPDPAVLVTTSVIQGHPARILTEISKSSALVVVASRGHGEFTGMLLGSVCEYLTAHAHCPVVVVRESEQSAQAA